MLLAAFLASIPTYLALVYCCCLGGPVLTFWPLLGILHGDVFVLVPVSLRLSLAKPAAIVKGVMRFEHKEYGHR